MDSLDWCPELRCLNCYKRSKDCKKCSGCNVVLYCSERCQKKDWKHHRLICANGMPKMYLKRIKTYSPDSYLFDDTNGPLLLQLSQNYWDPRYPSNYKYKFRSGDIKLFHCRAKYHCVECYKILPKETNWKDNILSFRKRPVRVVGLRCNECHQANRDFCSKHLQVKASCIGYLSYKDASEKLFTLLMQLKRIGIIPPLDLRKMFLKYFMTVYQLQGCQVVHARRYKSS